jgi:hypothetical protein
MLHCKKPTLLGPLEDVNHYLLKATVLLVTAYEQDKRETSLQRLENQ